MTAVNMTAVNRVVRINRIAYGCVGFVLGFLAGMTVAAWLVNR